MTAFLPPVERGAGTSILPPVARAGHAVGGEALRDQSEVVVVQNRTMLRSGGSSSSGGGGSSGSGGGGGGGGGGGSGGGGSFLPRMSHTLGGISEVGPHGGGRAWQASPATSSNAI